MTHLKNSEKLDKLDVKIISALHRNGRMTKLQLSDEVGLSATPCWVRIKNLEKTGMIKGYYAELDLKKLFNVFVSRVEITIPNYSLDKITKFENTVRQMPEIIECESILGSIDYILKILSRNVDEYQEIIERLLETCQVEVDYRTLPVSKNIKKFHQVNIQELYNTFSQN